MKILGLITVGFTVRHVLMESNRQSTPVAFKHSSFKNAPGSVLTEPNRLALKTTLNPTINKAKSRYSTSRSSFVSMLYLFELDDSGVTHLKAIPCSAVKPPLVFLVTFLKIATLQ